MVGVVFICCTFVAKIKCHTCGTKYKRYFDKFNRTQNPEVN